MSEEELEDQNGRSTDDGMPEPPQEEEEVQEFKMPSVEVIVHNALTAVGQVPTPNGPITLARFVTPAMSFTLKLDEPGRIGLIRKLMGEDSPAADLVVPQKRIFVPGQ